MLTSAMEYPDTRKPPSNSEGGFKNGASEEVRTLDIYLGKVVLYQLSYARLRGVENNLQLLLRVNAFFNKRNLPSLFLEIEVKHKLVANGIRKCDQLILVQGLGNFTAQQESQQLLHLILIAGIECNVEG